MVCARWTTSELARDRERLAENSARGRAVDMRTNRRLAAIMVADVVGYSRLMEADEAGTFAALKDRRKKILEPVVATHGGRIVKVMGDGVLVEFGSALDAVHGALELQSRMAEANEGVSGRPPHPAPDRDQSRRCDRSKARISMAKASYRGPARALAEPGGICISRSIREQVASKINVAFDRYGHAEPEEHRAGRAGLPDQGCAARVRASCADAPEKPVDRRPAFHQYERRCRAEYFSDGITEDVITELSRWHQLNVLSRNSSFQYRDSADMT